MNILQIIILIYLCFTINLSSLENNDENSFLDKHHKSASKKIKDFSNWGDEKLFNVVNLIDDKNSTNIQDQNQTKTQYIKNDAERFFAIQKYLIQTDEPFIMVSPNTIINSISKFDDRSSTDISANFPLSRFKNRFKVFISNSEDEIDENDIKDNKFEIGINYFSPEYYGIKSKYSLGVKALDPFTRARFSKDFILGSLDIELIQTVEYYLVDRFKERTELYFDTSVSFMSLFRVFLTRATEEKKDGMYYDGGIILFWQPSYNSGITFTNSVYGNTDYSYYLYNIASNPLEEFSGIYNYKSAINYRQNFLRKWLFFDISPAVNFDIRNQYEKNYSIFLSLDIFYADI